MAKGKSNASDDDDLLKDDDDSAGVEHSLEEKDTDLSDELMADTKSSKKDDQDDLELVILDEDAGEDKAEAKAETESDEEKVYDADEDSGETVADDDLITADERKRWSNGVIKRVERERRLKLEERVRANNAEAELAKAKADLLVSQKGFSAVFATLLERDIEAKTALLLKAKEDGKTAEEISLQGELEDLRAKKREADALKDRLEKTTVQAAPVRNESADRWVARNRWYNNPKFAAQRAAVSVVDKQLMSDYQTGKFRFAPASPNYFIELDRRLHQSMPGLKSQIHSEYGTARPAAKVAAVRTTASSRPSNGKVTLTKADLAEAAEWIDVNNKQALLQWALEKRKIERSGTNG